MFHHIRQLLAGRIFTAAIWAATSVLCVLSLCTATFSSSGCYAESGASGGSSYGIGV